MPKAHSPLIVAPAFSHIDAGEVLTEQEVAFHLKVSVRVVRKLIRDKLLSGLRVGRSWRVRRPDLQKYISGN